MNKVLYDKSLIRDDAFLSDIEDVNDLLNFKNLPTREFLEKNSAKTTTDKNKITYKIIVDKDTWIKFNTNLNFSQIEKIIYSKNWYGPKKITYHRLMFWSKEPKYYVNKIEWFFGDKNYLKVTQIFINMLASMEKLNVEDFYLPDPPKKCRDILDNYFLISKDKQNEKFNTQFSLNNDFKTLSDTARKLSFKEMVANSKTRLPIEYFHKQEDFNFPHLSDSIPSYILNYKTIVQSKEKGDAHDVVLTNIYLHLFKNQDTSVYCVRYKIDDQFIAEFFPKTQELIYKQVKISADITNSMSKEQVTISIQNNRFPIFYKRILLPQSLGSYGLPRIFEFNKDNNEVKNKLKFKQAYKTQIIKNLHKKNTTIDENYMLFAKLLYRQKDKETVDEILAIVGDYKKGINNDTRELLLINYQELLEELFQIEKSKSIFDEFSKLIINYTKEKNKDPINLIKNIIKLTDTF